MPPGAISERVPASSKAGEEYQLHGYWAPSGVHKRKLKGIHTPEIKGPLRTDNHQNWSLGCPLPPLVKEHGLSLIPFHHCFLRNVRRGAELCMDSPPLRSGFRPRPCFPGTGGTSLSRLTQETDQSWPRGHTSVKSVPASP